MAGYYHRGGRFMGGRRGGTRGHGRGPWPFTGLMSSTAASQDPRNTFRIHKPEYYRGAAPLLEQPQVLGGYSIDEDRTFGFDYSMLKYLDRKYLPEDSNMKVHLDLNKGVEKACLYQGNSEESFQNFLAWILHNRDLMMTNSSPPRLAADFISVRNTFTTIMKSLYNVRDTWKIYAAEYNGSIYMMKWKEEEKTGTQEQAFSSNFEVWGHKFEDYMTGGDPEEGVQANEEFRCVLKLMMDQTSLIYAPEVDCVDPCMYEEDFKDLTGFVLVKCCREVKEAHQRRNFKKFKLCQWWLENKLTGIPRIVIGYRNDDGIVHTLELMKTEDLPERAEGEWEGDCFINFLAKFLNFVKSKVKEDPTAVYKFEREEKADIYCTKMKDSSLSYILPSWYTEQLFAEDTRDSDDGQNALNTQTK